MLFNSLEFLLFFLTFFILYWFFFKNHLVFQNLLILIASYFFMAWWDIRFLLILIITSIINFILGIYIAKAENNEERQRILVGIGLAYGIGTLFFFKYCNFFIESLVAAFTATNININLQTLNIILPLGISFYTFRTLSYLLDVESGKTKPVKDWIVFFSYLSFFPCSLSGPIDKARDFVPQLEKKRIFNNNQATDALRQILWGLFKKIVIADNCSVIASGIFDNYYAFPGSTLFLGIFFYTIQIYADFSGYSDMAVGIARLMGFNVINNFRFPFFSQNIAEFWQRWHISLTIWLTEYVYTPLSFIFRKHGKIGIIAAIIINFVLVGLWHGANWTFVAYGFIHGCLFIPLIIRGTINTKRTFLKDQLFPTFKEYMNMSVTFVLVMLTMVFFNSNSIVDGYLYYKQLFSSTLFSIPVLPKGIKSNKVIVTFIFTASMFIIEWIGRNQLHGIANLGKRWYTPIKWTMYYIIIFMIFYFMGNEQQFIYFQF